MTRDSLLAAALTGFTVACGLIFCYLAWLVYVYFGWAFE